MKKPQPNPDDILHPKIAWKLHKITGKQLNIVIEHLKGKSAPQISEVLDSHPAATFINKELRKEHVKAFIDEIAKKMGEIGSENPEDIKMDPLPPEPPKVKQKKPKKPEPPAVEVWSVSKILERIQDMAQNAKAEQSKLKALELLGKSKAMFSDRVKVELPRRIIVKDPGGAIIESLVPTMVQE